MGSRGLKSKEAIIVSDWEISMGNMVNGCE